jgi:hypothetical protein
MRRSPLYPRLCCKTLLQRNSELSERRSRVRRFRSRGTTSTGTDSLSGPPIRLEKVSPTKTGDEPRFARFLLRRYFRVLQHNLPKNGHWRPAGMSVLCHRRTRAQWQASRIFNHLGSKDRSAAAGSRGVFLCKEPGSIVKVEVKFFRACVRDKSLFQFRLQR